MSTLNQIDVFLSALQKYLNQKRKTSNQQAKLISIELAELLSSTPSICARHVSCHDPLRYPSGVDRRGVDYRGGWPPGGWWASTTQGGIDAPVLCDVTVTRFLSHSSQGCWEQADGWTDLVFAATVMSEDLIHNFKISQVFPLNLRKVTPTMISLSSISIDTKLVIGWKLLSLGRPTVLPRKWGHTFFQNKMWIYIPCSLSLGLLGSLWGSLGTYGLTQKLSWKKKKKGL